MQRVTQYSLLIDKVKKNALKILILINYDDNNQLLKDVPQNDEDYLKLSKASTEEVDLIKRINDYVGKKNDSERLEWLEEHIPNERNIVINIF